MFPLANKLGEKTALLFVCLTTKQTSQSFPVQTMMMKKNLIISET